MSEIASASTDMSIDPYLRLIELGIALSAEQDHNLLLEKILLGSGFGMISRVLYQKKNFIRKEISL